jgi:Bifunctional DNA primase/polymerase, N-terminal
MAPESELAAAAHRYADERRPVFPCIWVGPKSKSPIVASGWHAATTNHDRIRHWWTRYPKALIGSPVPAGQVVLDVDPRHGGTLTDLDRANGAKIPATLTVISGREDGGIHLFYRQPLDQFTSRRLPDGIDLRIGCRHYTILPPSPHPDTGKPYRWEGPRTVLPLPAPLAHLILPAPRTPAPHVDHVTDTRLYGLLRAVADAADGNRNAVLYWSARTAFSLGADLTAELVDAAVAAGLPQNEAFRTVASAERGSGR